MRYRGLDLNLLVALDRLLEERHVSRAAQRMHVSQPAISAALSRLRHAFGDDLLVANGKRLLLTPQAEAMAPLVKDILARIDAMMTSAGSFDPARSDRLFRLVASDYLTAVLLPTLVRLLAETAPAVRLDIVTPSSETALRMERGEIDLFLTPEEFLVPDGQSELLFEEQHVVVGWRDNPVFAAGLTETAYFAHGHVVVSLDSSGWTDFVAYHLDALGRQRRVDMVVPAFSAVPRLLIGTLRLATMHRRLAELLAASLPLAIAELPFAFPAMREMCGYHVARASDPGLIWLRSMLRRAVAATMYKEDE